MTAKRSYCMHLQTEEGQASVEIDITEAGQIAVNISTEAEEEKTLLTFKSDCEVKGFIDILRWSRVRSLEAQGYKVVV